jgi:hypothetical protein
MLLDFVKVFVYKHWSFEVTAKLFPTASRRNEVIRRQGRKVIKARIDVNIEKVRKAMKLIYAVRCFEAGLLLKNKGAEMKGKGAEVKKVVEEKKVEEEKPKVSGEESTLGKE